MIKRDDIKLYTMPFYNIDGTPYVKLDNVRLFKKYLLDKMSLRDKSPKRNVKPRFSQVEVDTMKLLYSDGKHTAWDVAKQFKCSETTVLRAIHGKYLVK